MTMPGGASHDPDKDFRLLYDEIDEKYYIQKKRYFIGWKFIKEEKPTKDGFGFETKKVSFSNLKQARKRITKLREDNKKHRVGKRYVVIDV